MLRQVAVAMLVLLFPAGCGGAEQDRSGPIVFSARPDAVDASGWQLFVVNPDGSGLRRLTRTDGDTYPVWSPEAERVAFDRCCGTKAGVWVIDVEGNSERWLADGGEPDWSPNGDEIAFTRRVSDDTSHVVVISADGKSGRTLVEGYSPHWSPDAELISLERDDGLYVVRRDGTDLRRLTRGRGDWCADWSPDGDRIAFSGGRDGEVYIVGLDGSGLVRASTTGNRQGGDEWSSCPAWSPDGHRIAFAALGRDEPAGTDNEYLYAVEADGTNQRRLSPARDFVLDSQPAWSPDGESIVFTNDEELGELWVMGAGGSGRRCFVRGSYYEADQGLDWAARTDD